MSRHRIVRSMNYEDEYYDDDDEYSRSVEDSYCISPSTAAQFTWSREKNVSFASYMNNEEVIDEGDEAAEDEDGPPSSVNSLSDSAGSAKMAQLSAIDQAKLQSCLEEARNILGESQPDKVMMDAILQHNFNLEMAVNQLLQQHDAPKPQREAQQRRNRAQDDKDTLDLDSLLREISVGGKLSSGQHSKSGSDSQRQATQSINISADKRLDHTGSNNFQNCENANQTSNVPLTSLISVTKCSDKENNQNQTTAGSKKGGLSLSELIKRDTKGEILPKNSPTCFSKLVDNHHKENFDKRKPFTVGAGSSQKDMPSLSALVAQHSARKNSPPSGGNKLGSPVDSFSPRAASRDLGTFSPLTPKCETSHNSGKASLASLIESHHSARPPGLKRGINSAMNVGNPACSGSMLTQLAGERHTKSSQPGVSNTVTQSDRLHQGEPAAQNSALTLLQELSLEENKSRSSVSEKSKVPVPQTPALPTSHNATSLDRLLSGCLKSSNKRSPATRHPDSLESLPTDLHESLHTAFYSFPDQWMEDPEVQGSNTPTELDPSLVCAASPLGLVLCLRPVKVSHGKKRNADESLGEGHKSTSNKKRKQISYFSCASQLKGGQLYKDEVLKSVRRFDFNTMSPDDVVRKKQKQAFTRSDKEFTV